MKLGNCYRAFLVMMVMSVGTATLSVAAGPWKGRIVDLETKEPLEGAVALAVWERVYRTPAGPSSYFYNAKEVLTDKEGRFEIPAYRPINLLPLISFMRGPHFTVFKPGYLSLSDINLGDYLLKEANIAPAELMEKGKAFRLSPGLIELPRLKTREERLDKLQHGLMYDEAEKKARNFMRLLNIERMELGLDPIPEKGARK